MLTFVRDDATSRSTCASAVSRCSPLDGVLWKDQEMTGGMSVKLFIFLGPHSLADAVFVAQWLSVRRAHGVAYLKMDRKHPSDLHCEF